VDWAQQRVRGPQGKWSLAWWDQGPRARRRPIFVELALEDCQACPARALCTRAPQQGRRVGLPPQDQYEALRAAQTWYGSEEGTQGDKRRAGGEGTLAQGVRGFGWRCARYRGLEKTHLQHRATAAAIKVDRMVAWLEERPRAQRRTSRCAALAPACARPAGRPPEQTPADLPGLMTSSTSKR
jgi:transposase